MKKKNQEKRLGFNFLLSYYEVFKRLPDAESKEKFITSICEKQFFGKDPKLDGIVEFAYASQKHSIDKSRKGWDDSLKKEIKNNSQLFINEELKTYPLQGPLEGSIKGPSIQEKEEDKDKEKEEEIEKEKKEQKKNLLIRIDKTIQQHKLDRNLVYDYMNVYIKNGIYDFTDEERKKINDDLRMFKIK